MDTGQWWPVKWRVSDGGEMTIEQVMALEGSALSDAVAKKMGRFEQYIREGIVPNFAGDWNAAMRVREWARGLYWRQREGWIDYVAQATSARTGKHHRLSEMLLYAEPIDYARAALLVLL